MKNYSIKTKLWSNLALFIAFFIGMWLLSYYASTKISDYLDPSKIDSMRQADILRQSLKDIKESLASAVQLKDPDFITEAEAKGKRFRQALGELKKLDPGNLNEYENALKDFDDYTSHSIKVAHLMIGEESYSDELLQHAGKVRVLLPKLTKDVDNILSRSYDTFKNVLSRSKDMATLLVTQNFVLLITVVMLSAIIFPMIIRSIIKPIDRLVYATNELAQGNLDVQADIISMDEIGALALSFNRMTRSLKEKSEALEKTTTELKASLEIRKEMQARIMEANNELKGANLKLREADRLKTEFLASMSHELRTPLNAIINFTDQILEDWELLSDDENWSSQAQDMLSRVLRSSKHLLTLINDLLDIAKIESGFVSLDLQENDIREIVADAIASLHSLAKSKGLYMRLEAPEEMPNFLLDERRVLQIFINLLSNAIKFTNEGGVTITVRVDEKVTDGAFVDVTDTGIGIQEKAQAIVFDRFRQVDGGDSRTHAGTGIGLNLVKELVDLHNGNITLKSEVGKGSTFTVFFPYKAKQQKIVTDQPPA